MRDVLLSRWSDVSDKIVKLAEELPEEKYDYRPSHDVRSFAETLRHVAFWNNYAHKSLKGEDADGSANELSAKAYPTKSKIVAALRESFDGIAAHLKNGATLQNGDVDTVVSYIEHNGEHYGQMALCFRLNGLVPPASR